MNYLYPKSRQRTRLLEKYLQPISSNVMNILSTLLPDRYNSFRHYYGVCSQSVFGRRAARVDHRFRGGSQKHLQG